MLIDYGIVNIDKPKGPTSHQTADYVKRILNTSKAGHSGTLDPQVTGVLVIAFGKATRVIQALLPAGKEYIALMYLHKPISERKIRSAFKKYQGIIRQKPPVKSSVRRIERERTIYYVDIIEIDSQNVLFKIGCQAGTYIRKYIHDFGKLINCGAHMSELRRTKVATFDESTLYTLQDLKDALYYYQHDKNDKYLRQIIQPVENAVLHLPKIWVLDTTIASLSHGRDIAIPGISKLHSDIQKDDLVAIMSLKDELLGLGHAQFSSEDIMKNNKGIAIKTERVFIAQ